MKNSPYYPEPPHQRNDAEELSDQDQAIEPKNRQWMRIFPVRRTYAVFALITLVVYLLGLGSGYGLWGLPTPEEYAAKQQEQEMVKLMDQVNPADGYMIPAKFGDLGPKMVAAGVFDAADFEQLYQQTGQPLNDQQLSVLKEGAGNVPVVFHEKSAYFLLNFFWAVGLSNQNPVLDSGPIQQYGQDEVESFASTAGWTMAKKPIKEIYSSLPLISLTEQQQKDLEEAAQTVYRPCCDNPTLFPDCNHGMAMLGLMELMASQGATVDQMLLAAKAANAYWYPTQTVEQAIFFKNAASQDYADIDARQLLGRSYSSGSGFQDVHQYLVQSKLLPQALESSNSCGV